MRPLLQRLTSRKMVLAVVTMAGVAFGLDLTDAELAKIETILAAVYIVVEGVLDLVAMIQGRRVEVAKETKAKDESHYVV